MNSYSEFQNQASSEKIKLAVLRGSRKLTGFVAAGEHFVLSNFDAILEKIEASGIKLMAVDDLESVTEGKYFNDRFEKKLYVSLFEGKNPNLDFIVSTQFYFFSDKGVALPFDLKNGEEVYFEPLIKDTSQFGVELDVENQGMSAIEGGGSITFHNDFDFWLKNFDKIWFDNQEVEVYSWSPLLRKDQAKLLFRGFVDSKNYGSNEVKTNLKDLLYKIRSNVALNNIGDLGARIDPSLATAKQRIIYGKAKGFRPVNLDRVVNKSYPLIGTVAVFQSQNVVIGTGTQFKKQLVKNDKVVIAGNEYTVAKVTSDVGLELTSNVTGITSGNLNIEVIPSTNKPYMNRKWLLSGHSLSEPTFKIQQGSTTQRLIFNTTNDIYEGDDLWIGEYPAGELVSVKKVVNSKIVTLSRSTEIVYPNDTPVFRPCVQNVRLNDLKLVYGSDYTADAIAGTLTLSQNAEANRAALLESNDRISVVNGSNVFTGSGTKFTSYLKPGDKIRPETAVEFNQILSVTDQEITLTEPYTGETYVMNQPLPQIMSVSGLDNLRETYTLKCIDLTNVIDLQQKFLKLYDHSGSVAIWFDIGNVGVEEPEHGCDRAIEITTLYWGNSKFTMAERIKQKLDIDGAFITTILGDTLYITSKEIGVRPPAKENDANFLVTNLTRSKQRVKCMADIADSLHQQFVPLFDSNGSVALWFDVDNVGAPEPDHNCDRAIKVSTVVTDDSATTVRDKALAELNLDPAFVVTSYGVDSLEVNCEMVSMSLGNLPGDFELNRLRDGKSLFSLSGKHFILPFAGTPTDKLLGVYFDIDAEGVAAPGIVVDEMLPITNVNSFDSEETFFQKLSAAIDGLSYFTTEVTDNSILITSTAEDNVDTDINQGNAQIAIELIQAGVAANPTAGRLLQYKNFVFGDSDVLSCDVYGKTKLGDTKSELLKVAPEIVRDLLIAAGSGSYINEQSFSSAKDFFSEELSLVIPEVFSDKASTLSYRDIINNINASVFGLLLQSDKFQLEYASLRPNSKIAMRLDETDIISYKITSTNKNMISTAIVEYGHKEFDYLSRSKNIFDVSKNSKTGQLILKTTNRKTFSSLCVNEQDAQRLANRFAFILENSSNVFTFTTKLQTTHLQVNDIIHVNHSKLYHRLSSKKQDRLMMIEAIGKSGTDVEIVAIDLSAAFNRSAKYTDAINNWENASDDERLFGGFYKASDSLIANDPESAEVNLYW